MDAYDIIVATMLSARKNAVSGSAADEPTPAFDSRLSTLPREVRARPNYVAHAAMRLSEESYELSVAGSSSDTLAMYNELADCWFFMQHCMAGLGASTRMMDLLSRCKSQYIETRRERGLPRDKHGELLVIRAVIQRCVDDPAIFGKP